MLIELHKDEKSQTEGLDVANMSFDMTKTAKLFHMLSSTLYSNKISSIIRELASNAHDSHLMNNNLDVPFNITIPTYENPVFSIRDYGVGLDKEEALKTILCYLGSSKDHTDEFIGGWGIGSKSPFAYASTYTVKVYKNGVMTHFQCWKDENGIPNTAVVETSETLEPNGVLMEVPVDSTDISTFYLEVNNYKKWTNYNITVNGEKVTKDIIESKDMGDYEIQVTKGRGDVRIVYGGFSYDFTNCVTDRYSYNSEWSKIKSKISNNYDVAFIISQPNLISFNMNREVIEESQKSIKFVNDLVTDLYKMITFHDRISKDYLKTIKLEDMKTLSDTDKVLSKIQQLINESDQDCLKNAFIHSDHNILLRTTKNYKVINRTKETWVNVFSFKLAKIKDQMVVSYGRLAKIPTSKRTDLCDSVGDDKTIFYFKANTLEECKNIIKEEELFKDFDLESVNFQYVDIPKKVINHTRNSSNEGGYTFITDESTKKRQKFEESKLYVYYSDSLTLSRNQIIYNRSIKTISGLPIFLKMTGKNIEKFKEFENVISLEEYTERYNKWFDDLAKTYVDGKFISRLHYFISGHSKDDKHPSAYVVDFAIEADDELSNFATKVINLYDKFSALDHDFLKELKEHSKKMCYPNVRKNLIKESHIIIKRLFKWKTVYNALTFARHARYNSYNNPYSGDKEVVEFREGLTKFINNFVKGE